MTPPTAAFGLGFLGLGLFFVAIAIPLIQGRVKPNDWYGIRIPAAFASEEAWYRINRHGGKSVLGMGVAVAVLGALALVFLPHEPSPPLLLALALAPGVFLIAMLVHVYRYPR